MGNLSKHFDSVEFACPCCGAVVIDDDLIVQLERLREYLGRYGGGPIHINSGFRCFDHNTAVGGVRNSQHLYGKAADITVVGVSPFRVQDAADLIFSDGGMGRYNTFTHVDVRGHRARWDQRSSRQ